MHSLSLAARRIETQILQLDRLGDDARNVLAHLRAQMDGACDRLEITLAEWRVLVELITGARSQCDGILDLPQHYRPTLCSL